MKMKTVLYALVGVFFFATTTSSFAITTAMTGETSMSTWTANSTNADIQSLSPEMLQMNLNKFLTLTPSKYKEMTGKRLGLRKSLALKGAQKLLKSKLSGGDPEVSKGLYILLAIIGLGFVGVGLMSNWEGNDWIFALLLGLCWLPGLIYALIKMKDYYK